MQDPGGCNNCNLLVFNFKYTSCVKSMEIDLWFFPSFEMLTFDFKIENASGLETYADIKMKWCILIVFLHRNYEIETNC